MAEGARSFEQVMRQIGQSILAEVARTVADMVAKWAAGVATRVLAERAGQAALQEARVAGASLGLATGAATASAQIANFAATAAAGAYAALSQVPLVGPILGAAAAASVFGAVLAFKGMIASAAGGFDIPAGVNPLTQLHAQEMVLPARLANPMRSFLEGYGGGGVAGGGDAHLHYAPTIHAPASASLRQMLVDQGSDMISFVQAAIRNGALRLG